MLPERVYSFNYDHNGVVEKRFVFPIKMESGLYSDKINVLCYDFVRRDVRRFSWDRIGEVEDVTQECLVFDADEISVNQKKFYINSNMSVYESENNKLYVVNV